MALREVDGLNKSKVEEWGEMLGKVKRHSAFKRLWSVSDGIF